MDKFFEEIMMLLKEIEKELKNTSQEQPELLSFFDGLDSLIEAAKEEQTQQSK
jgi:predicted transcriptional regulator